MSIIKLKNQKPLILNITNQVTTYLIADGLLALGASPIMSDSLQDALELVAIVDAIVINIGTLNDEFIQLCHAVCQRANELNKKIIFDPVGVNATNYRLNTAKELLSRYSFAIIRANADEINALAGEQAIAKGLESASETDAAIAAGITLSKKFKTVVVITGKVDRVIAQDQIEIISGGSILLTYITGGGCLLTSIIAAFAAVNESMLDASVQALQFYASSAEKAEKISENPASFKSALIDNLYAT